MSLSANVNKQCKSGILQKLMVMKQREELLFVIPNKESVIV